MRAHPKQLIGLAVLLWCVFNQLSPTQTVIAQVPDVPKVLYQRFNEEDSKNLQIISTASRLQGPYMGRGGGSPVWGAYSSFRWIDPKFLYSKLEQAMPQATPAGKIYIACAYWDHNRESGIKAFKALLNDKSPVEYSSGCTDHAKETVSSIAKSFIEKGSYSSFEARKY